MNKFIDSISTLFKISCPNCKKGKLNQNDIHFTKNNKEVNIYTCSNCSSKFI
jgi:DNA-directed RNA polymerase subunit RPC12/RpoP